MLIMKHRDSLESARKLDIADNNTEVTKNETRTSEHILANNIYQQPHTVKPKPLACFGRMVA